jgi:phage baseplate assembly protein gpV
VDLVDSVSGDFHELVDVVETLSGNHDLLEDVVEDTSAVLHDLVDLVDSVSGDFHALEDVVETLSGNHELLEDVVEDASAVLYDLVDLVDSVSGDLIELAGEALTFVKELTDEDKVQLTATEVDICNNLFVYGDVALEGENLTVNGDVVMSGEVSIVGDTSFKVNVDDEIILDANEVDICANLFVDGDIAISGDVSIFGVDNSFNVVCEQIKLDADEVDVCGNLSVNGNIELSGDVSIFGPDSSFNVECDEIKLDASQVDICGNLDVQGDLTVNGVAITGGSSLLQTAEFELSLGPGYTTVFTTPSGYICSQITYRESTTIEHNDTNHNNEDFFKIKYATTETAAENADPGTADFVNSLLAYDSTANGGKITSAAIGTSFDIFPNNKSADITNTIYLKLMTSAATTYANGGTGDLSISEGLIKLTAFYSPLPE